MKMRKIAYLLSMLAVLSLASCTAEKDVALSSDLPLGTSSFDNAQVSERTGQSELTPTPIVRDISSVTDEMELTELVNEYIHRVYDIGDEYCPEYVDESTSAEDMISSVNQNGVTCEVKKILIAGFEKINNSEVAVNAIVTADYASVWDAADEYYISMRIECIKKDDEWKVNSSDWYNYILSSLCTLEYDETSGEYMYMPIEE